MKKINWKPKIVKINIEQKYNEGLISPTMTAIPYYYWVGTQYIKWLFWEFKMDFRYFNIFDNKLEFTKIPPNDCKITLSYIIND